MKIGLLGGSFNPIHNGHIAIAKEAIKQLKLEQVWFLPTGKHPFKSNQFVLPFCQRLALIQKAIVAYPDFAVKDFDDTKEGFNFTAELLRHLYHRFPENTFYFIIGEDNIPELPAWHHFDWLIRNVHFIVVNRPTQLTEKQYDYCRNFTYISMQPIPISSSDIRQKIAFNQSIEREVPAIIWKDVCQLYANKEETMKEITTLKAPCAIGAYSQAVEKNGFVYLSGQLGIHPETSVLATDFAEQVRQIFCNIEAVLKAAKCSFANVVKVTVFLQDMNRFQEFNSLYQNYFSHPFPAREAVEVSRLPRDADLEISIIAMK